jgi:lipopolysaccharide/colanic/teichoic acid biosynthesis glycosyltransferase
MLLKFRSMREDAEKETGPVWAEEGDKRVTRVGKIIRTLRLDEIPQLINVLRGEMSFVGPRPERPHFVEDLKNEIPFYDKRHAAKPGITGWAQIKYPYGASRSDASEKLKYDLYYIKNMSPFLDLEILFQTLKIVFFGRGAR